MNLSENRDLIPSFSKGLVLPFKRTRFDVQKESFWSVKGVLLEGKRTTFENHFELFRETTLLYRCFSRF